MLECLSQPSLLHVEFRICILRPLNRFKQVIHNINFKLIYIDDIMSLMWETTLWNGLNSSGFIWKLIENCMHVVLGLSKCYNRLVQMLMFLIYHMILALALHLTLRI